MDSKDISSIESAVMSLAKPSCVIRLSDTYSGDAQMSETVILSSGFACGWWVTCECQRESRVHTRGRRRPRHFPAHTFAGEGCLGAASTLADGGAGAGAALGFFSLCGGDLALAEALRFGGMPPPYQGAGLRPACARRALIEQEGFLV